MLLKGTKSPVVIDNGGFIARLNMPGWLLPRPNDHGHGPLAMIVESILVPGKQIAMHEHRNDEIVSWVPEGVMRHDDRTNGKLVTDSNHLMVMNAGRSFWHSEETFTSDPPLRMLQILVRPSASELEPGIQFMPIKPTDKNEWRHLFGPEGGAAPLYVRNSVDFFDIRLDADFDATFPKLPGRDLYFYVFSGAIVSGEQRFDAGEQGLWLNAAELALHALEPSIVVAFLIDPNAQVAKQGTVGDNRRIPPPYLARPLMKLLNARNWLLRRQ